MFLSWRVMEKCPKGGDVFFDPVDSRGNSPEARRETGLSTAMLAEALRDMPARRVVLIIDACQSGGVVDSLGKIGEVKAKAEVRRAELEAQAGTAGAEHQHAVGVYVIAATTPVTGRADPWSNPNSSRNSAVGGP